MESIFSTPDIVLAATLHVSGYRLLCISLAGNKGHFVFEGVHTEFVEQFDLKAITVEPQDFNNAIKSLTSAVRRQLGRC